MPAIRMPCLRGSSSTKPTGALRRPGLRRSSNATCWPPLPAPTISTSVAARSRMLPRVGRSTIHRTAKRAPLTNASESRKSSASTPRGGSCLPIEKTNRNTITPTEETTTAFRIVSKSFWSTNRHSFEYRPNSAKIASFIATVTTIVSDRSSSYRCGMPESNLRT